MRWLKRLILVSLAIIIAGSTTGLFWLKTSLPLFDGTMTLRGLEGLVAVKRETEGIPRMKAKSQQEA